MDATDGSQQPQDVPTLRELIQRHTDRTGESRRALGDRSGMSHQTLGYWAAGAIKTFPDPDTIRSFAKATGYSEQTVLLAAAKTVGLRVTQSGTALTNTLPPGTDSLQPEDVDAIWAIVRQLVDARQALGTLEPDMSSVEGVRIEESSQASEPVRNGQDG